MIDKVWFAMIAGTSTPEKTVMSAKTPPGQVKINSVRPRKGSQNSFFLLNCL